jgi:hypothetical protein
LSPELGRRHWVMGFPVPTLRLPSIKPYNPKGTVQDFTSVWFIISEQSWVGSFTILEHVFQSFYLGYPVQTELLEIPGQRVHQAALVAIELA